MKLDFKNTLSKKTKNTATNVITRTELKLSRFIQALFNDSREVCWRPVAQIRGLVQGGKT